VPGEKRPDPDGIAAALRQISRGFAALAEAMVHPAQEASREERCRGVMVGWGKRGLTRAETSALFRKHGFAPQASGGWARGDWIESRTDGRRYLTQRSLEWLAKQETGDEP
jgi:hypothetical protein